MHCVINNYNETQSYVIFIKYLFNFSNKHNKFVKKFCFNGSDEVNSLVLLNGNDSSIKSSLSDKIFSKSIDSSLFS